MTNLRNCRRYFSLHLWDRDTDLTTDGHTLAESMSELVGELYEGQDDGHTVMVLEVEWDAEGAASISIVTDAAVKALVARYEAEDNPDGGLAPDDRPWLHPLAEQAGFQWTPTDSEVADMRADAQLAEVRDGA